MNNAKKSSNFERIHGNQSSHLSQGDVVHCSVCYGSYSRNSFHKHKKNCQKSSVQLKPQVLNDSDQRYAVLVLNKFHRNEIGNTCRTDDSIRNFGRILFQKEKTKVDKVDEVVKSVAGDMRLISRLFCGLKLEVDDDVVLDNAASITKVEYWKYLREVIDRLTVKEELGSSTVKHGLKMNIHYTLLKFADVLIGESLEKKEPTDDLEAFKKVLKHHQNSFFGDAIYKINKLRQEALRLPERIPDESYVKKLRDFSLKKIEELTSRSELTDQEYVQLRNLIGSRLTLFNARRGGETFRLKISHWNKRQQWFRKDQIEDLNDDEREYFNDMEIMYSTGITSISYFDTIRSMASFLFFFFSFLFFQVKETSSSALLFPKT